MIAVVCILLNYGFLKLFVDGLGWYPTPSLILTSVFVVLFSYLSQRHFSFRTKKIVLKPGYNPEPLKMVDTSSKN
jgi:putative flippase GtrA